MLLIVHAIPFLTNHTNYISASKKILYEIYGRFPIKIGLPTHANTAVSLKTDIKTAEDESQSESVSCLIYIGFFLSRIFYIK